LGNLVMQSAASRNVIGFRSFSRPNGKRADDPPRCAEDHRYDTDH
jgi:hypothetical protein